MAALAVWGVLLGIPAPGCGGSVGSEGTADTLDAVSVDLGSPSACYGPCGPGTRCDESAGVCVACLADADCAEGERCDQRSCLPEICTPGESTCAGGVEEHCLEPGTRWESVPCGEDQVCAGDVCRDRICVPGSERCQGGLIVTCLDQGLSEEVESCPEGELCVAGQGCTPVRHNLVLVVDTSGSMNRQATTADWFAWPEPWPGCEPAADPGSRIGTARKLFRQVISGDVGVLAQSHLVLMRFPQRATGKSVLDTAAPAPESQSCTSGLWLALARGRLEGDDGSHGTSGPDDWFAEAIWQAVLVPDPRRPRFAGATAEERRAASLRWLDGTEEATPGADALACTHDSELEVCGADRPCLGPEGARTCHDITEPELRAQGETPLGRTLYYASEYLRRFVYVDGKACAADADCASANYVCEDGACADPLRFCRKSVVLLFTDGTEHPVPDDEFFRAGVQAKRLAFGLGCAEDEDCVGDATCGDGGTCLTPALEAAARDDDSVARTLSFVDPEGAQRLEDPLGRAIPVTTHVVDVAYGSAENARLAALGRGVLIHRALDELEALVADLESVFDIKVGAQCMTEETP